MNSIFARERNEVRHLRGSVGNAECQNAIPLFLRPVDVIKTHSVNSFLINCEQEQRSATRVRVLGSPTPRLLISSARVAGESVYLPRPASPLISISIVTFNSAPNCFLDCGDTFNHFSFSKMSC